MSNPFIKTAVRTLFTFTSQAKALQQSEVLLRQYKELADGISSEAEQRCVEVPPMRGVAEDNPFFPRLRSGHRLFQRPSPGKQFPSNNPEFLSVWFPAISFFQTGWSVWESP